VYLVYNLILAHSFLSWWLVLKLMTDSEAAGGFVVWSQGDDRQLSWWLLCCVAVIDKVQDQLEAARPATLVDEVVCVQRYFIIIFVY